MDNFEVDLLKLIENIQFRTIANESLNKLYEDIKKPQS